EAVTRRLSMPQVSLEPATDRVAKLVRGVPDDRLGARTPSDCTVGDLLDHIQILSQAFAAAAEKSVDDRLSGPPPRPDASRLGDPRRDRIPQLLARLEAPWNDRAAAQGLTRSGGVGSPG